MRQRAMIAMVIANDPDVLIADEPTTALDVTIQAQILEVIKQVQERTKHRGRVHHARSRRHRAARDAGRGDVRGPQRGDRQRRRHLREPRHPVHGGLVSLVAHAATARACSRSRARRRTCFATDRLRVPAAVCATRPRSARSSCRRCVSWAKHDQLAACHFSEQLMGHWDLEPMSASSRRRLRRRRSRTPVLDVEHLVKNFTVRGPGRAHGGARCRPCRACRSDRRRARRSGSWASRARESRPSAVACCG